MDTAALWLKLAPASANHESKGPAASAAASAAG